MLSIWLWCSSIDCEDFDSKYFWVTYFKIEILQAPSKIRLQHSDFWGIPLKDDFKSITRMMCLWVLENCRSVVPYMKRVTFKHSRFEALNAGIEILRQKILWYNKEWTSRTMEKSASLILPLNGICQIAPQQHNLISQNNLHAIWEAFN